MIFINNKYTTWYNSIINKAKIRVTDSYTENHHIIPKSLGGKDNKDNLVKLTAKEHFVCHLLLTKMTSGNDRRKMSYALWLMINLKNKNQNDRYIPNSNMYDLIRKRHANEVSKAHKGKNKSYSSFAGKKHSEETLKLQREIKLGDKNPNYGVVQKPEWNLKKSITQKGKKKPLITCEYCNTIVGGHGNYIRWHGVNCRINNT